MEKKQQQKNKTIQVFFLILNTHFLNKHSVLYGHSQYGYEIAYFRLILCLQYTQENMIQSIVQHKCDTSDTNATRLQHECCTNDTHVTRVKIYFHAQIFTIMQVKDYKERNNFILRTTLSCSYAKMRLKNASQKLNFAMAKAISKSYPLDCSCKCPCTFRHSSA